MTTEVKKLSKAAFRLMDSDRPQVQFTESEETQKLDMTIYSGGVIKNHWWWGDLAIDLKGLKFPKGKYPLLENHDTSKKIAFMGKGIRGGAVICVEHHEIGEIDNCADWAEYQQHVRYSGHKYNLVFASKTGRFCLQKRIAVSWT